MANATRKYTYTLMKNDIRILHSHVVVILVGGSSCVAGASTKVSDVCAQARRRSSQGTTKDAALACLISTINAIASYRKIVNMGDEMAVKGKILLVWPGRDTALERILTHVNKPIPSLAHDKPLFAFSQRLLDPIVSPESCGLRWDVEGCS